MPVARRCSTGTAGSTYDLADDTIAHQHAILASTLGALSLEAFPSSDPITCSVINAATGVPAKNMRVTLCCTTIPTVHYHATTNERGNILSWKNTQSWRGEHGAFVQYHGGVNAALKYTIENYAKEENDSKIPLGACGFRLDFNTLNYFKKKETNFAKASMEIMVNPETRTLVKLEVGSHGFIFHFETEAIPGA